MSRPTVLGYRIETDHRLPPGLVLLGGGVGSAPGSVSVIEATQGLFARWLAEVRLPQDADATGVP